MFDLRFIGIFLLVMVVEYLLLISWNSAYFRLGIPMFKSEVAIPRNAPTPISADLLENWQHESLFQPLTFCSLDDGDFAFREVLWNGFFHKAYTPIMHGLLRFDRETNQITVFGYANWATLVFAVLWLSVVNGLDLFWVQLILPVAFGSIYVLQYRRFRQVAIDAASLMGRPTSGPFVPKQGAAATGVGRSR
jgi:hypothetical protein